MLGGFHLLLIEEQCSECVRICRDWLQIFEPNDSRYLSDVVTETRYTSLRLPMVSLTEGDLNPEVLKIEFTGRKIMFAIF